MEENASSLNEEPPSTPKQQPSYKSHHARRSFASPIQLPIRSDVDLPSPNRKVAPRSSFYLEKAVPVSDDTNNGEPEPSSATGSLMPDPLQDELIFDDGDERLPAPESSPMHQPTEGEHAEADIMAIASPTASPGAAHYLRSVGLDEDLDTTFLAETAGSPSRHAIYGLISPRPNSPSYTTSISNFSSLSHSQGETYYPAPIPTTLIRPPLLSKKGKHVRRSSAQLEDLPPPPQWGISPLEREFGLLEGERAQEFLEGGLEAREDSDVDSDRATIMSDDRDEFDQPGEHPFNYDETNKKDGRNRRSWFFSKVLGKSSKKDSSIKKDEMGEKFDVTEADNQQQQMPAVDIDMGFSRMDPETVQRHSQMFNAGGVHNSIAPRNGAPTSLIEELEIRKAGRRIQKQVFFREITEIERQRAEDAAAQQMFHPVDIAANNQPTLIQMQHMADVDYQVRVQWHKNELNKQYKQENSGETLAQRRARLKAQKLEAAKMVGQQQETLAQRRQRLRRARELELSNAAQAEPETIKPIDETLDLEPELSSVRDTDSVLAGTLEDSESMHLVGSSLTAKAC